MSAFNFLDPFDSSYWEGDLPSNEQLGFFLDVSYDAEFSCINQPTDLEPEVKSENVCFGMVRNSSLATGPNKQRF